jgi:hypothetical protein
MPTQCPDCKVDLINAQVSLRFARIESTDDRDDWPSFPVLAGICPQCGRMDLHMATPQQFRQWLDSEKARAAAATGEQWAKTLPGSQGGDIPRR